MVGNKAVSDTSVAKQYPNVTVNNSMSFQFAKRTLDIVLTIVGLLLLSIVFLIISIAIKIEDPKGPVLFSQKRIGKDGKEFNMYKFRSMVTDAEAKLQELLKHNETSGAMFKM